MIRKGVINIREVIVLSDLHGQMLVFPKLAKIWARYPRASVVFLGDYQDSLHHHTGFATAKKIFEMQRAYPTHVFAIQGNHDAAAWESLTGKNEFWLDGTGEDVIAEAALATGETAEDIDDVFQIVKQSYAELIAWMGALPLTLAIGNLLFVHAGLDLTLADPIADTPRHEKYWLREPYWYGPIYPNYAHNPLDYAIISGHTPTSLITGIYDAPKSQATLRNRTVSPSGVLTIQYAGEQPRYFVDGGNHSGPAGKIGNIAVFDADSGRLIEAFEDK